MRLEDAGALSGLGLDLSMRPDLTYEQYASIGALLGRATTSLRFAVGDWLVFGEDVFGERGAQASELLGISPEGRMELARVARAIPRRRRRAGLAWGHHRLVAARWMSPGQREELLDEAERSGWAVRELEAAVRDLRALESGLHVEDVMTGCDGFEDGVRDLRTLACSCFGEVAVEVLVRAPGVHYRVLIGGDE
ncbi:MAG: hypothetical protein ABWY51_01135 [Gaiellaceae bacterium]|jgi:hypothetical protein